MTTGEIIQLVQVGAPIAQSLVEDLIGLFKKHAPNASVTDIQAVAAHVAVIANKPSTVATPLVSSGPKVQKIFGVDPISKEILLDDQLK